MHFIKLYYDYGNIFNEGIKEFIDENIVNFKEFTLDRKFQSYNQDAELSKNME